MEGILYEIGTIVSPVGFLSGLCLLAVAAAAVLLVRMADKEASGESVFWAESPFTETGEIAPEKEFAYPKAA